MPQNHDPGTDAKTEINAAIYAESVRKLATDIVLLKRYRLQRLLGPPVVGL